jgi:hypothetical protein
MTPAKTIECADRAGKTTNENYISAQKDSVFNLLRWTRAWLGQNSTLLSII